MPEHRPVRGILLCIAALALFACMDTTTKFLAERYEIPLIMAVRYLGNLLLMVVVFAPREGRALARTERTGLVLVRGMCLAAASFLFGSALAHLPVADATAIGFLAPILLVAAAGRYLGERIGWVGWLAVGLGFVGVMLIARPGRGLEAVGVMFALGAVAANLSYQFLSRLLARTETTVALLFYTALCGSLVYTLLMPGFLDAPPPSSWEVLLLASLGLWGGLGHFLFTAAFRHAPASLLAPFNYTQLLWAGLLGWLVFGHIPDAVSLLGMAIIAGSGIMVALKTRRPPPKRTA
jgi:drug/metabolite transporter (DMT)-like permease